MKLTARDLQALRHFEAGPVKVSTLFPVMGRTAAYDRVKRLVKAGYLQRQGSRRALLPAGREALAAAGVELRKEQGLAKYIPHIGLAPTVLQQALLTLIASAIALRQHRVVPSHHASFLLFGRKLTWKSWIAKFACWMAGIDPREFVMNLGVEIPGSLLPRRDARGQIVSERNAIRQPVMGLDELGRAKGDTIRAVQALLHGDIEIPFENVNFEVLAVPIVTMNPKSDKADLTERLGLDEGTIRRSVLADLSKLVLPEEVLTEGDALLDQARDLGPATFPAPRHPEWRPTRDVKKILLRVVDTPERLAEIDIMMVALLCTGLTAWCDKEDALRLGLRQYLEVISTLGWLKPGWRSLVGQMGEYAPVESTSPAVTNPLREDGPPNPLDYTAKVDQILAVCRTLGISPEEAAPLMEIVRDIGPEQACRLVALDTELADAGMTVEESRDVLRAGRELADRIGTSPRRAAALNRGVLRTMIGSLPEDADKTDLKATVAAVAHGGHETGELRGRARGLRREITELKEQVEHLCEAERRALEDKFEAEDQLAVVEAEVADLGSHRSALRAECKDMKGELEKSLGIRQLLAGNASLDGALAWELSYAFGFRAQGQPLPTTVPLSPTAVKEILDTLKQVLDPSIVSIFDLPRIQAEARKEGVNDAVGELEETLASLPEGDARAGVLRSAIGGLRLLAVQNQMLSISR